MIFSAIISSLLVGGKINSSGGLPAAPAQQIQQGQDFIHSFSPQTLTEHSFPTFNILLVSGTEGTIIPRNVWGSAWKREVAEQVETRGWCWQRGLETIHSFFIHSKRRTWAKKWRENGEVSREEKSGSVTMALRAGCRAELDTMGSLFSWLEPTYRGQSCGHSGPGRNSVPHSEWGKTVDNEMRLYSISINRWQWSTSEGATGAVSSKWGITDRNDPCRVCGVELVRAMEGWPLVGVQTVHPL